MFSKWIRMNFGEIGFQILTAARMKTRVFWDAAPCSLVDDDQSEPWTCYSEFGSLPLHPMQ
jgi:hypothetical protein